MSPGPVGLGATVLARGLESGRLDGIGVYSRHILGGMLARLGGEIVRPVVFGQQGTPPAAGAMRVMPPFSVAAGWMALHSSLQYPFSRTWGDSLRLFHATDHYIPRLRPSLPVVATVMDIIPLRHPEWVRQTAARRLMNRAFAQLARSAAHVVTISEFSAWDISQGLGIPRERISVTHLGVDPSFFQRVERAAAAAALRRFGLEPGFFLFVGTLQPRKNVERILQAHRSLPPPMRRAHPLVVVGAEGWQSAALLEQVRREQAAHCRWLSHVAEPDLHALLQNALALVYPSLFEGFGLPVLEAFAARTPVISSGTTSIPEVAGDAALLIDPTSVEQLRDAMQRMTEDAPFRQELAARGLERARSFTWDRTLEQTLEVYRRFVPDL